MWTDYIIMAICQNPSSQNHNAFFSQPLESIVSIVSIYLALEWLGEFLHSSSDPKKRESCKERLKKKSSLWNFNTWGPRSPTLMCTSHNFMVGRSLRPCSKHHPSESLVFDCHDQHQQLDAQPNTAPPQVHEPPVPLSPPLCQAQVFDSSH